MNFQIMISLRNLMRQKRRNILLGISIAFGVMILIVANSFSHGISDVMFNRIIRYVAGHVSVTFYEKNKILCQIFRDKKRLMSILEKNSEDIIQIDESVGLPSRAIGNGKSENVMIIGIDTKQEVSDKLRREYEESFKMVEGTFEDLNSEKVENPAILSTDKAQDLNVKMNDIIRVRFKNIFGQDQAARITVVGIMKITNIFMSGVIFVELLNAKSMMGYSEFEMGSLNLTLKNPVKNAVKVADRIHSLLKPDIAVIVSQLSYKEKKEQASILCFQNDENAKKIITENTIVVESQEKDFMAKKGVLITNTLAKRMELHSGDKINISYENKFRNKMTQNEYVITGIFEPKNCLAENVLLLNENIFYDTYYDNLPKKASAYPEAYIPAENDPVYKALGTEWILLPRTKTTDEFEKKLHELTGKKGKATFLDVATMYEIASAMLNLEKALNIITLCAVFVLFFIILIGVVNTLRMTIRERTREIGTMRAIGMQKNEVRNIFIFETFFLTFFSSLTGIIFAFLVMRGISGIKINMSDNPLGMFLIDEHLFFLPTFSGIFLNVGFIILIAVLTAYFPARKAANLKAAEAFRHYE